MQQGEEVLALVESIEREADLDVAGRPALTDDVPEQVEIAIEAPRVRPDAMIHQQQTAQLAVVDTHVGVDQVIRERLVRHGFA